MKNLQRFLQTIRPVTLGLGLGLATLMVGCSGPKDGESPPEIAKAQEEASSAWAKAKAEGKDKRKTSQAPSNPGSRGFINRPGS